MTMRPAVFLASFALALVSLVAARPAAAQEEILSFDSNIIVRSDGALDVTETLEVRVEGRRIRRGILRDFPTSYEGLGGTRVRTGFDVQSVLVNGGEARWTTERLENGVRLRIGERDVMLKPGVYVYTINYLTDRQLYFGEADEDQLYFNVTGDGWEFPIREASAVVRLPEGAGVNRTTAFTGARGSNEGAFVQFTTADGDPGFRTLRILNPGEGFTIAVGWPSGFVTRPDAVQDAAFFLRDNAAAFAAGVGLIIVFLYFLAAWIMAGRDPAGGAIIARYGPPPGFSPAAAHFVSNMGYSDTAFTAAVVDMAVKGYLRIEDDGDGNMTLRAEGDKMRLSRGEREVAARLFGGLRGVLEIDQENHKKLSDAQDALKKSLAREYEAAHFVRNRDLLWGGVLLTMLALGATVWLSDSPLITGFMVLWLAGWSAGVYAFAVRVKVNWVLALNAGGSLKSVVNGLKAVAITAMFLPFLAGIIVGAGFLASQISIPAVILILAIIGTALTFHHLLKAPTRLGRKVMDEIEGFREYLRVAEADRMEFHNPPERTPELFEKYLPFAIALGVEHQWGEKFDNILAAASADPGQQGYRPRWYNSPGGYGGFHSSSFSSSMGAAFTGAIAAASAAPSSSGGGFSGGGFSGGGGGGGGGGGW